MLARFSLYVCHRTVYPEVKVLIDITSKFVPESKIFGTEPAIQRGAGRRVSNVRGAAQQLIRYQVVVAGKRRRSLDRAVCIWPNGYLAIPPPARMFKPAVRPFPTGHRTFAGLMQTATASMARRGAAMPRLAQRLLFRCPAGLPAGQALRRRVPAGVGQLLPESRRRAGRRAPCRYAPSSAAALWRHHQSR